MLTDERHPSALLRSERARSSGARAVDALVPRDATSGDGRRSICSSTCARTAIAFVHQAERRVRRHRRHARLGESDERAWDEALARALVGAQGAWVAQERIAVRREVFPVCEPDSRVIERDMLVDFAPYLLPRHARRVSSRASAPPAWPTSPPAAARCPPSSIAGSKARPTDTDPSALVFGPFFAELAPGARNAVEVCLAIAAARAGRAHRRRGEPRSGREPGGGARRGRARRPSSMLIEQTGGAAADRGAARGARRARARRRRHPLRAAAAGRARRRAWQIVAIVERRRIRYAHMVGVTPQIMQQGMDLGSQISVRSLSSQSQFAGKVTSTMPAVAAMVPGMPEKVPTNRPPDADRRRDHGERPRAALGGGGGVHRAEVDAVAHRHRRLPAQRAGERAGRHPVRVDRQRERAGQVRGDPLTSTRTPLKRRRWTESWWPSRQGSPSSVPVTGGVAARPPRPALAAAPPAFATAPPSRPRPCPPPRPRRGRARVPAAADADRAGFAATAAAAAAPRCGQPPPGRRAPRSRTSPSDS